MIMTPFDIAMYCVACIVTYFVACVWLFKRDERKRGENK